MTTAHAHRMSRSCVPMLKRVRGLIDLGLAGLSYRYVTTDCGWSVFDSLPDGSLTWNETLFARRVPVLRQYLHDLGLLSGVYEDAGMSTCTMTTEQAGSLCRSFI